MFSNRKEIENNLNNSYFYNHKLINIKMLNGDIFSIELNEFDDEYNIINKICSYNNDYNDYNDYRLRKHRIKILKEGYEDKSFKEIVSNLEHNDLLYIYSESLVNVKKYYFKYSYGENVYNYFYIKDIEDYYDSLDRLYFEIYDKELPSLFIIDNNFFNIGYSQMYIDILIKTIFEKEDITRMFFNCSYINDNLSLFINCIIKYYKDLDTVCFDLNYDRRYTFNNKYSFISELNKLFDKISNTKNVYLNSFLFKIVKEINLLNNDNIYIFGDEVITNCDYILKKIKSFSNNIFIKHRNNIQIENNGWINMAIYDDNNYLIMKK